MLAAALDFTAGTEIPTASAVSSVDSLQCRAAQRPFDTPAPTRRSRRREYLPISVCAKRYGSGPGPQSCSSGGIRSSSPSMGSSSENDSARRFLRRITLRWSLCEPATYKNASRPEKLSGEQDFHSYVLHRLGILAVASDIHGEPKDLALVAVDQFLKSGHVARFGYR